MADNVWGLPPSPPSPSRSMADLIAGLPTPPTLPDLFMHDGRDAEYVLHRLGVSFPDRDPPADMVSPMVSTLFGSRLCHDDRLPHGLVQLREPRTGAVQATIQLYTDHHVGLPGGDADCPCEREPCDWVSVRHADPRCELHRLQSDRTVLMHRNDQCPGLLDAPSASVPFPNT